MKKVLLTIGVVAVAASVLAQGTVNYFNNGPGFSSRVYGPEAGALALSKTGNTTAQTPAGTQVYTGVLLGTGYRAQMFGATGNGAAESALVAATTVNTFRSGSAAGILGTTVATFSNIAADAPAATIQLRAWDNTSGNYPTWAEAEIAWNKGLIAAGKSLLLNVGPLGGGVNSAANPIGLQSFNIYFVPEPSTMALAGLGAAAMMIFRRRK